MAHSVILLYGLRLLLGCAAVVCAVLVWNRSRDSEWLFLTLGALCSYGETLVALLDEMGFVSVGAELRFVLPAACLCAAGIVRLSKL